MCHYRLPDMIAALARDPAIPPADRQPDVDDSALPPAEELKVLEATPR